MPDQTPPSFSARYWEAARCVAASRREFARLSLEGVEYATRTLRGYERRTAKAIRTDGAKLASTVAGRMRSLLRPPD